MADPNSTATGRTGARRITQATVDKAKLPEGKAQHDIFDNVVPGFGLRLGKTKKTWFVMTRQLKAGAWKQVRVSLGDTAEIDLPTARQHAQDAIASAKQGKDPHQVRAGRRAAMVAASRDTFASVREDFLARYVSRGNRRPAASTMATARSLLNVRELAPWHDRPLADIRDRDIIEALDQLIARDCHVRANRLLSQLRVLFRWAKDRRIVTTNPTTDIHPPGAERPRERVLTLDELAAIWHATAETACPFNGIVRALILTGQRRTEMGALAWKEITADHPLDDHRTCTAIVLPPERCKNRRRHVIPCSTSLIALIEAHRQHQARLGLNTDYVFSTTGSKAFATWDREKKALDAKLANVAPWHLHDLRRSAVTHMAEKLKIAPHVIEAVVNHQSGSKAGVAGVYNRAEYLPERAAALEAWGGFVLRLAGERHSNNVVALRELG